MKKTYINPSMEIVKIASQTQMLAGSPGSQTLSKPGSDPGDTIDDGDLIGGRSNGFDW